MKSSSQIKVSAISFMIALFVSLAVFGIIAYFSISGFMSPDEPEQPEQLVDDPVDDLNNEQPPLPPDEVEKIHGESFTVLVAGYDLQGLGFDAMAVVDVDKENQKVTVSPLNVDTKVYVGHGDSYSLNVRTGDLIKYKDMKYVVDKINATTGLKIEYYVTFTAEGFVEAFDAFNKNKDYTYKVPADMEHVYVELPDEAIEKDPAEETTEEPVEVTLTEEEIAKLEELKKYEKYNISFKKGDTLSEGIDVYNMLRYKGDSSSDRITRQAAFVKDVVTKIIPARFKEGNLTAIVDTAKALIKLTSSIETNISVETFITETFDLISAMPSFSYGTVTKYTSGIANFK